MRRSLGMLAGLFLLGSMSIGCPDKDKAKAGAEDGVEDEDEEETDDSIVETVGGAPKRQVEAAEARINAAAQKANARLNDATEDDKGGW